MKVIFAPAAEADLEQIGEHIRKDNPGRAITFVNELVDHSLSLALFPRRFALVPRYAHSGIRRAVHGNYLIFYRVGESSVEIVHVLNGAMDYESILFAEGVGPGPETPT